MPEIDGLRFLAITMVVIFHMQGYFTHRTTETDTGSVAAPLLHVLSSWDKGVMLFFVISGFILALPFATHTLKGGKKVSLKSFYLRRVTRLEPPYFIAMISMFCLLLAMKVFPFRILFPSLLASLTYTHNIIFGTPLIAVVTWSLEVEIQFYLIAPFMASIFKLNQTLRRGILIILILLLPVLQHMASVPVITLYSHLQYFLLGFLLTDFYVCQQKYSMADAVFLPVLLGLACLGIILFTNHQAGVFSQWILLTSTFVFYYFVLFHPFWRRWLSIPVIAVVGGMCYSIYLWHFTIISLAGRFIIRYHITGNYTIDLIVFCLLLTIPILIFSGFFFYMVEKPCMSRDWYKGLLVSNKA